MKQIDLLPNWYRASRRRKRDLTVRGTLLGVVVVGLSLVWAQRHTATAAAREDLTALEASFAGQAEVIRSLGELESRLEELSRKQQLLCEVAGGVPVHALVGVMSELMPPAVGLTEIRIAQPGRLAAAPGAAEAPVREGAGSRDGGGEGELDIQGWAASDVNVGSLMTRMTDSPVFADIRLRYSKPVIVGDRMTREFRLTARIPAFE